MRLTNVSITKIEEREVRKNLQVTSSSWYRSILSRMVVRMLRADAFFFVHGAQASLTLPTMSETIELRDDPQRFRVLTLSAHEVESLPGRLHNHGESSQATVQPTAEGSQEDRQTSKQQATTSRVQFATLCWCLFLAGWNDGTIGPLLPRIREAYNVSADVHVCVHILIQIWTQVGFAVVSLIFVFSCVVSYFRP